MKKKYRETVKKFFIREKISALVLMLAGIISYASIYSYHHHVKLVKLEERWNHILFGEGPKDAPPITLPSSTQTTSASSTTDALVLVYHKVYTPEQYAHAKVKAYTTTTSIFDDEMRYLKDHGYVSLTMHDFLEAQKAGRLPAKPVVITFDDGWKDQYVNAFPILKKYNMKATFYIYTGVIGSSAFMDWNSLRDLSDNGMELGDHTEHHPNLKRIPQAQLSDETLGSKQKLEQHLGITVTDFAYPYGLYSDTVTEAVKKAGFLSARTSDKGITHDFGNPYTIKTYYAPRTLDDFVAILKKANTFGL